MSESLDEDIEDIEENVDTEFYFQPIPNLEEGGL